MIFGKCARVSCAAFQIPNRGMLERICGQSDGAVHGPVGQGMPQCYGDEDAAEQKRGKMR